MFILRKLNKFLSIMLILALLLPGFIFAEGAEGQDSSIDMNKTLLEKVTKSLSLSWTI